MKAALCVLLLVSAVVLGADEKKNEKRGVLGLGYGLGASAPLVSHGYYGGHGLGLFNHGLYGGGLYGGGLYGGGLVGHGLVGHGLPLAAPAFGHGVYSSPLLGLGHGYLH